MPGLKALRVEVNFENQEMPGTETEQLSGTNSEKLVENKKS